jgi:uncharacterized metal-binding protein
MKGSGIFETEDYPTHVQPEDVCWFCKQTRLIETPYYIRLYQEIDRQEGIDFGVTQEVHVTFVEQIFQLPRCGKCHNLHNRYRTVFKLILWLIPAACVVMLIAAVLNRAGTSGDILFALIAGFFIILIGYRILQLIYPVVEIIADACGLNTQRRARIHQPIRDLLNQSWKVDSVNDLN